MTRVALLSAAALLCGACASTPSTDRSTVERPEVQRAQSVEPEGLSEMRNTIAEQRTAARERDNALMMRPNTLSAEPETPWYNTVADGINWALRSVAEFKFLGL